MYVSQIKTIYLQTYKGKISLTLLQTSQVASYSFLWYTPGSPSLFTAGNKARLSEVAASTNPRGVQWRVSPRTQDICFLIFFPVHWPSAKTLINSIRWPFFTWLAPGTGSASVVWLELNPVFLIMPTCHFPSENPRLGFFTVLSSQSSCFPYNMLTSWPLEKWYSSALVFHSGNRTAW